LDTSALLAKEINLTAAQEQQHRELREAHFKNVGLLYDSIRQAKTVLFTTTNTIATDSLLEISNQKINNWQSTINVLTVSYLQKVRKLLTEEQQKGYDQFVIKMMQRGRRDSSRGR
jgi:Spy/CpxP family protein refolding chaperone